MHNCFRIGHRFECNSADLSIEPQLELIDLQAIRLLKEKHSERKFVKFYCCLSDDEFPKLKKFISRMASMFETTYSCEQIFQK